MKTYILEIIIANKNIEKKVIVICVNLQPGDGHHTIMKQDRKEVKESDSISVNLQSGV